MISGVDHIAIAVHDWAAAVQQVGLLLGSRPVLVGGPGREAAWFRLRNTRIVLVSQGWRAQQAAANEARASGEGLAGLGLACEPGSLGSDALRERGLLARELSAPAYYGEAERAWELAPEQTRGIAVRLLDHTSLGAQSTPVFADDEVEAVDHVVIRTAEPDKACALYRDRLGIRLALDRELGGTRMLFFRVGGVTIEVIADPALGDADAFYGLAYRVRDAARAHARLSAAGFAVSDVRDGRKPGTQVFTLRSPVCGVASLFIRDPSRH